MKRSQSFRVILLTLGLFLFGAAPALQAQLMAFVEREVIMQAMPDYKRAKSELEAFGKQLEKKLEGEEQKIMAEFQKAQEKSQRGEMSPAEEKQVQEKLVKMQEDFAKNQQKAQEDFMKKEQDLTKPIYDKLNEAFQAVAKANNYSYIVDKKHLLYHGGGIDATPKVKAHLGIQ